MALCALNLKDTEAAKGLVDTLKRDYPKDLEDPIVKQAINAVSIMPLPLPASFDAESFSVAWLCFCVARSCLRVAVWSFTGR